jgi:hypothetical protein
MNSNTPPRFTEATKATMAELAEIKKDHEDNYHLYDGIYHVIDEVSIFAFPLTPSFPRGQNCCIILTRR